MCLWTLCNSTSYCLSWGKNIRKKERGTKKIKIIICLLLTNPVQGVLLVFLDATWRGDWALLFSLPMVLRGWGPGLGHNIHSFQASVPVPLWAAWLKSATHLLTAWVNLGCAISLSHSVSGAQLLSASGCAVWDKPGIWFHLATQSLGSCSSNHPWGEPATAREFFTK